MASERALGGVPKPKVCVPLLPAWVVDHEDRIQLLKSGQVDLVVAPYLWKGRRLGDILQKEVLVDFEEKDPMALS